MLGGRTSPRLIPAPMDIALTHRLSFKQASLTVLVAFILGTLLSLIQVGVDYASQDASINREVRALLDVSHNPAARIAYNIDAELAQELVLGLLRSPAVVRAEIIDTSGLPLASASRESAESRLRPLSDFLFGHKRVYEDPLHVDHAPGEALGVLHLEIDTFVFGNDFLRRAGITLLSGFVRSLLLSLILLVLFYTLLTKPLVSLIQALSGHDPRSPARMRLPCPKGHERDEIGVLVEVINRQLGRISVEIEQRREAENRLTQYLEELESIVAARTAELKAANARLTLSNQELEEARQTALDMAQARASFLANMSHEIRTPLNGLLGMLSLSLDGPLTPEQRQQLSIAHDSGKVLVELLNDVLDLSKFEAGQLVLEQIPFDLGVLVEDTASLLSQNAAAGVELTCLVDPALPAQVSGDPTRIRQVVSNLLSNALKFTRLGRVDVRVEATAEGVRISVRDTGIGIAQEALDRIFQPFTQADAGITRQYGGTGLGLALTRKLCEAMQGELTVESTVGLGSLFSVGLPL
ncbi:hybrid sensor histidine kinase/response regulator, partial [Pseudomonas aeruginosa]|nr:hybrid sensor histidine kinase/response regulator [Pseudomonas aeruginosa]MBF3287598.1 hybrid sensor histidine kinase/response regulator [Pseudomonas aeruginosa]